jgi:hypothetical protein
MLKTRTVERPSAVHVFSVPHSLNLNFAIILVNYVYNTIIANADAKSMLRTYQFLGSIGKGIVLQGLNYCHNSMRSKSVGFLEVLSYGGLEGNFKGGHLF